MKKTLIILGTTILALIVVFFLLNSYIYNQKQGTPEDPDISSYTECVEAGYPSLDSYPEQCETPSGKRFVRNLPEQELESVIAPITVRGTLICLPHWNTTGPQTLECAIGLLSEEGDYYVLRASDEDNTELGLNATNSEVEVSGMFVPGSSDRYQSIGTIEVEESTL